MAMLAVAVLGMGAASAIVSARPAAAHPLGNFTINHYAGLEIGATAIAVDYVLDLAELPTFQEREANDVPAAARCEELSTGLTLTNDGVELALVAEAATIELVEGQAGLSTTRIECRYRAALPGAIAGPAEVTFEDGNYPARLGWREVTASGAGVALTTDLPAESISGRLTDYPEGGSSPQVSAVSLRVAPGDSAVAAELGGGATAAPGPAGDLGRSDDPLLSILASGETGPLALAGALALAAALGALHGLAPGHGKTAIGAFLVATRGTRRQAFALALAVAVSHTLGVFVLGAVTVLASSQFAPERAYPYLQALSGMIMLGLGIWIVALVVQSSRSRPAVALSPRPVLVGAGGPALTEAPQPHGDGHDRDHRHDHESSHDRDHGHGHGHGHGDGDGDDHGGGHDHDHDHGRGRGRWHTHGLLPHRHGGALRRLDPADGPLSTKALAAIGLSGGLVPSTAAVILLLGAIQLERLLTGGLLILAFGAGMAVALVGAGFGVVALSRRLGPRFDQQRWAGWLTERARPAAGVALVGVGLYLTTRALLAV